METRLKLTRIPRTVGFCHSLRHEVEDLEDAWDFVKKEELESEDVLENQKFTNVSGTNEEKEMKTQKIRKAMDTFAKRRGTTRRRATAPSSARSARA